MSSFGNGGQLSFSHTTPISAISFSDILLSTLKLSKAYNLNLHQTNLWPWYIDYLKNRKHINTHKLSLQNLAAQSLEQFQYLAHATGIDLTECSYQQGLVYIFNNKSQLQHKNNELHSQSHLHIGGTYVTLTQLCEIDQAFAVSQGILGGVITQDITLNCYKFCQQLYSYLKNHGVDFIFNTEVTNFKNTSIICTTPTDLHAKNITFCTAAQSQVPQSAGLLSGLRGYSVDLDISYSNYIPHLGIIDEQNRMVYSTFKKQNILRIAGFGDLWDSAKPCPQSTIDKRCDDLLSVAYKKFPTLKRCDIKSKWTGLRPISSHSTPIIKAIGTNTFLNTAHANLGFTLSFASGKIISKLTTNINNPN